MNETTDPPVPDGDDERRTAEQIAPILQRLNVDYNFDFRQYKTASLARRIRARMSALHVEAFPAYLEYLERHPDEAVALFNTILINVTGFFRDPEAWEVLRAEVVPTLIADAEAASRGIRVWCVGCSTGEEAYSVAITLAEALTHPVRDTDVKIYATDIDEDALTAARHGLYRPEQLRDLPPALLERYFAAEGPFFRVRPDVRRWCIFGRHDIATDSPLSHVDLLVCRNLLIYFKSDLQARVLPRFQFAVRDGGFLFLGKSESVLAQSRSFVPINVKWRIFRRTSQTEPQPVPQAVLAETAAASRRTARADPPNPAVRAVAVLPTAVFVIDPEDTVTVWNHAAATLFEIPPDIIGRQFRELDISYRAEGLRARVEDVKTTQTPARLPEAAFTRRTGEVVHIDASIVPLLDDHRRLLGIMVSATDTTEIAGLKERLTWLGEQHETAMEELQSTNEELETTNEELQSTNEELFTTVDELQAANAELNRRTMDLQRMELYLRSILESVGEAVVVLDRAGVVTTWNHAAERLWGLPAAQALGRAFLALPIDAVVAAARDTIGRIEAGEARGPLDVAFSAPSVAPHRTATLRLVPLVDAEGTLQGVVGVARTAEASPG